MRSGSYVLWCPTNLRDLWWRPLLRNRYCIQLAPPNWAESVLGAHLNNKDKLAEVLHNNSCGLVMPGAPSLLISTMEEFDEALRYFFRVGNQYCMTLVDVRRDAAGNYDGTRTWWIEVDGSHKMVPPILRSFLASGALPISGERPLCELINCSELYSVPLNTVHNWWRMIPSSFATVIFFDDWACQDNFNNSYRDGDVVKDNFLVRVSTGPSIDAGTQEETNYLGLHQSGSQVEFIEQLKMHLLLRDANRVPVILR